MNSHLLPTRSTRTVTLVIAWVLLLVAPAVAPSEAAARVPRTTPSSPFCALLVDPALTASTVQVRRLYLDAANAEIGWCAAHHGYLYADIIAANSQASPVEPVRMKLVAQGLRGNELYDRSARLQVVQDAKSAVARLFAEAVPEPGGTDLLGGLVSVGHVFDTIDARTPKYLVIASSGLQTRTPYNLTASPLDAAGISALMSRISPAGLVASLGRVKTYLVGFGVGPRGAQLDPTRLVGLRNFWHTYLQVAQAALVADDKVLIGFP